MEENKNMDETTEQEKVQSPSKERKPEEMSVAVQESEEKAEKEEISYEYGQHAEQTQNNYQDNYSYNTRVTPRHRPEEDGMDTTPLTMGDWILTLLAMWIPCCGGIILYFYWAFSKTGNLHRRNFCRAALIVEGVAFVIMLIFLVLVVGISGLSGLSYYYGY